MEESKLNKLSLIQSDLKSCNKTLNQSDGVDEATHEDESQKESSSPVRKSIFTMKSANQTIEDAMKLPDLIPLYGSLWLEGELSCLFADSNVGKSIFAVQMADSIARQREEPVLYFDFELDDRQFKKRYVNSETGEIHIFPDNFQRLYVDPDTLLSDNFEDDIIFGVEDAINRTSAKIIIIDNISFIGNGAEKGDIAGRLMVKLKALTIKYELSMLVLAHTPKRDLSREITQNDLAGSKKLFNFFRSAFVIAQSQKDANLRYIKQVKVTSMMEGLPYYYNTGRVMVFEVKQVKGMVRFVKVEDGWEKDHLKGKDDITDEVLVKAREMQSEGKSYRKIADELNVKFSTLYNKLKK